MTNRNGDRQTEVQKEQFVPKNIYEKVKNMECIKRVIQIKHERGKTHKLQTETEAEGQKGRERTL